MNFNNECPICKKSKYLKNLSWSNYVVKQCTNCGLDYCAEMKEKEIGGDSSPVHLEGIEMMANSYFNTYELAFHYAKYRKVYLESHYHKNFNSVLEVGCGPGVFYKAWSDLGVKWRGVDINPYWREFGEANNIPIESGSINNISSKFDLIMAYQVIEHVEDPIVFINTIIDRLNPGGIIHLELPNHDGLTSRFRKISSTISHDYGFIQPPMHLRAYRKKTLEFLFNLSKLSNSQIFTCNNTDSKWGQVRNYKFTQKLLYKVTGFLGVGSLLIAIGQKESN